MDKKKLAVNYIENGLYNQINTSIAQTISILEKFVGENIPIVDENNILLSIISENDVLLLIAI